MSIARLPEELILYIHFLAENPFLPLVHPTIYHNLHFASKRYIARYLYSLHRLQGSSVLVWSLRHPICTIEVAQEIAKLWQDDHDTPLTCPTLPTRLFRQPNTTTVPPLLEYLFNHYSPSPNDPSGYPLSRSVLSKNEALIRYLLSKGAHPGVRGGLAVRTAVQIKRLDLVRLLVEPASTTEADVQEQGQGQGQVDIKKRKASDSDGRTAKSPKRQRREDRYKVGSELVELAMNAGADDIVQYFVSDKGVMPPLKSIMSMGKQRLFKAKRIV